MAQYTLDIHFIGGAVQKPKPVYHLIDEYAKDHIFTASSLVEIHEFCKNHTPRITNNHIRFLIPERAKALWHSISNYDTK